MVCRFAGDVVHRVLLANVGMLLLGVRGRAERKSAFASALLVVVLGGEWVGRIMFVVVVKVRDAL